MEKTETTGLKEGLDRVLNRYFEYYANGEKSKEYDPCLEPETAIDLIVELIDDCRNAATGKSKEAADEIEKIFARYFECDDVGNRNPEYDETFSAADAIDEIVAIRSCYFG